MADASEPGHCLLAERLREHAQRTPARIACTFLRENGSEHDICYGELAARVDALAAQIHKVAVPGARLAAARCSYPTPRCWARPAPGWRWPMTPWALRAWVSARCASAR